MRFKPGDKVRVVSEDTFLYLMNTLSGYPSRRPVYWPGVSEDMLKLSGEIVTIEHVYTDKTHPKLFYLNVPYEQGFYKVLENLYIWSDNMFEELVTETPKNKLSVKPGIIRTW